MGAKFRPERQFGTVVGGIFLLISLPPHLYTVWDEYPAWYHFVYLLSLVPIAGFSGRLAVGQSAPVSRRQEPR